MDFTSWNQNNDTYLGNTNRSELKHLPPGAYILSYDKQIGLMFNKIDMHYDQLIDLPSPEYDYVMKRVGRFLSDEGKRAFAEYNFIYKWNCLLHGTFGTGKTCIVNRVAEKVVANGGIVLFSPDPRLLQPAFKILDDIQPDRTTMVIFEEFETLLEKFEGALLSLLDGEVQKKNIIYMATTNHFEKIPARLKRPGRFPTILEVKFPNAAARTQYLTMKLKPHDQHEIPNWVKATNGLSIDELKETVQSVKCYMNTLDESVKRILGTRKLAREAEQLAKNGEEYVYHTDEVLDECEEQEAELDVSGGDEYLAKSEASCERSGG